jgi:hypothetical protein
MEQTSELLKAMKAMLDEIKQDTRACQEHLKKDMEAKMEADREERKTERKAD